MGKVVTFGALPYSDLGAGAKKAPITTEPKEMLAEMVRIAPGGKLSDTVPAGADRYFYVITGEASIAGGGSDRKMPTDSYTTIAEGTAFTITNSGSAEAELLSVFAPPPGAGNKLEGYKGPISVVHRSEPTPIPADHGKRRVQFVDKTAAKSDRAHAMIVLYSQDTVTNMHMHPNAESMFVVLTGKVNFKVNGEDTILSRGQAVHFPAGDRHGLHGAEGDVSFLEFHIPAGYTTVRG